MVQTVLRELHGLLRVKTTRFERVPYSPSDSDRPESITGDEIPGCTLAGMTVGLRWFGFLARFVHAFWTSRHQAPARPCPSAHIRKMRGLLG